MENKNNEAIVLDNGNEYLIAEDEIIDGTTYTLFVNTEDKNDICFRKTIVENGEEYYVGLDDDKEFNKVLIYFTNKNLK